MRSIKQYNFSQKKSKKILKKQWIENHNFFLLLLIIYFHFNFLLFKIFQIITKDCWIQIFHLIKLRTFGTNWLNYFKKRGNIFLERTIVFIFKFGQDVKSIQNMKNEIFQQEQMKLRLLKVNHPINRSRGRAVWSSKLKEMNCKKIIETLNLMSTMIDLDVLG